MIKNILIKCARMLDREDLCDELANANSIADIQNKQSKNDILKLISNYNYITNLVCTSLLDVTREDDFISDSNCKIYFNSFLFRPIKIVSVNNFLSGDFKINNDSVVMDSPNRKYTIRYKFLLEDVNDFKTNFNFCELLPQHVLVLGIISQYLSTKGKYNESEYYYAKFMYEIFNLKNKKERRLKPSFCL